MAGSAAPSPALPAVVLTGRGIDLVAHSIKPVMHLTPGSFRTPRLATRHRAILAAMLTSLVAAGVIAAGAQAGAPKAPALSGTDPVSGQHVDIATYRGKAIVVNIWASWCPGCNEEARDLASFAKAHPDVAVLGIDTRDTKSGAKNFYRKYSWRHPSISDSNGAIAARWALQGLPTTYFINRDGKIVGSLVGAGTREQFEQGLKLARTT